MFEKCVPHKRGDVVEDCNSSQDNSPETSMLGCGTSTIKQREK